MRKILNIIYAVVLILLLSYQSFATDWYVDNTASGSNNGTSWTNAWQSLAAISWASLNPGDNVYISGGPSGKTYAERIVPECRGNATNWITIIAGKYAPSPSGHSGRVTIQSIWVDEYSGTLTNQYIHFKGFEITSNLGYGVKFDADVAWTKAIIIDSCYIHDWGVGFGIGVFAYSDSIIIQNNIVIDCSTDCSGDRDNIHVNEDAGHVPKNIIIRNNYVHSTSQDPNAHNDAFQAVSGDGFYVYNNVFINDSVNSPEGGGMPAILSAVDDDNNDSPPVLVFNNFLFMNGIWMSGANQGWVYELRHDAGTTWAEILPTYIFGNTMVSNGPRNRVFGNGEAYVNVALNNIWASFCPPDGATRWRSGVEFGNTHGWMEVLGLGAAYTHYMYQDSIRNNLFWRQDSTGNQYHLSDYEQSAMIVGDGYVYGIGGTGGFDPDNNWADWIAKGGTGLFRDPKLVTPFGNLSDQGSALPDIEATSPAIDAGEDYTYLVSYLATTYPVIPQDVLDAILVDFYGNERGADGNWDIGAVEYGATAPTADTTGTVSFTSVSNAELSSYHIAYGVVSGLDSTAHVYTSTSDSFAVGYPYTLGLGVQEVENGDTIAISNTASGSYSTADINYIVLSGTSRSFTVTTKADPYVPPSGGGILKGSNGIIIKDSTGKVIKTQ